MLPEIPYEQYVLSEVLVRLLLNTGYRKKNGTTAVLLSPQGARGNCDRNR